jgi:eukaryotic-like serine/threonine-protein kinase
LDFDKKILILNRYRILEKIASGGMADIYLGEDLKLKRKVAVKILSRNYAGDRNFVARFKSEAQVLAKLKHPNIVDIYDWGKSDDSYFIIMEYIDGMSLKELIDRKGALDSKVSTHLVIQICEALLFAHNNNLIHRDVKPQNILITSETIVKVTDFGIAKSLNTDITKTLNIVGTAHYISPEQARGSALDNRTDIYSLGVVFYEMLTGDTPFRGDTSVDISLKHVSEKPAKLSSLIVDIPVKLEKIVMACLEKDPGRRYENIESLKGDLNNYLEGKPVLLGRSRKDHKRINIFARWISKNSVKTIAIAVAIIFFALFLTYSILFYEKDPVVEEEIKIPPIHDMHIDSARQTLSFFNLDMEIIEEVYNDTVPENYVIEQDPGPNGIVTPDKTVEVIVSMGSNNSGISIPNMIGLKLQEALKILESMDLETGTISEEYSEEFERDHIIKQTPAYGETADKEDSVDITISMGSQTVIIPNIIGLDLVYASNHLESLGINVITSKIPLTENVSQPGLVVSVTPQPGTSIIAGSTVELKISTSELLNEIPDITGLDLEQAKEKLGILGIGIEIIYIDTDYSVQQGEVLDQLPLPGSYISLDSSVVLFIGK